MLLQRIFTNFLTSADNKIATIRYNARLSVVGTIMEPTTANASSYI